MRSVCVQVKQQAAEEEARREKAAADAKVGALYGLISAPQLVWLHKYYPT